MITALLFLIIVLFSGMMYAYIYYSKENVLKDAITMYNNGEIDDAVEKFRTYVVMRKDDVIPRIYLSKIYFEKKDNIDCIRECVSITINKKATNQEKSDAYAMMGEIYLEQNQINRSAQMIAEGLRQMPKNPKLHYTLGLIYLKTEKINNAIVSLNNVLANDRGHIPARLKLAYIHQTSGDMVKAVFQYKKVIELESTNQDARYSLAMIYFNDWNYEKAYGEMKFVKETEENAVNYNYVMSKYFLEEEVDKKRALIYLEKLLLVEGNSYINDVKYEVGKIYQELERYQEAFDLLKTIQTGGKNSIDIEKRLYELEKILNPKYYEELLEKIDYNKLSVQETEELFYKMLDTLGYKEVKLFDRGKTGFTVLAVDKYRPAINEKYFITMLRSEEEITLEQVNDFRAKKRDEKAQFGILITTSMFEDGVTETVTQEERVTLIDKINIYELMGG